MKSEDIRKKFLEFFKSKGHAIVPSSSLIPDDPSVLLTTAGMQQFKPYYTGEIDPMKATHPNLGRPLGSLNAASVQKSFRTSDIEEVGDERHLTFFEMLGNFSFGGYFKKEAIQYAHEFITEVMGLTISYVTVFRGMGGIGVPRDRESTQIWKELDVKDVREEGIEDVFWGPTGLEGPCGPTTEIYCKNGAGQDIEIWNIVFNEFFFSGSREELLGGGSGKKLEGLKTPGVDTGMGLERLAMIAQKTKSIFETDLFKPYVALLPESLLEREKWIIADHLRAAVFLIADGVHPSNKEAGYILRRLLRRALVIQHLHSIPDDAFDTILLQMINAYGSFYRELLAERKLIFDEFVRERKKFGVTLAKGVKEVEKNKERVDGAMAFDLYQSFGLPFEITQELVGRVLDQAQFKKARDAHAKVSSLGQEKKFGGHGLILDTGELRAGNKEELEKVTRLHTATHMLQQALREVLGPEVRQAGSDITAERTRFDFTFPRKLTPEEIQKVEGVVNKKIKEDLPMRKAVLPKAEAEKTGALYLFKEKYPDPVNVYFIGKDLEHAWSKEFCGGPHVTHTGEIGEFKIAKEEAVGAGVRRIRGIVVP